MSPSSSGYALIKRGLVYPALFLWSVVCLFPIYWLGITSVKGLEDIDKPPGYLPFVDFQPSLKSWRFILADAYENLLSAFWHSLVIGLGSTITTLTIGGMVIYGLTRFPASLHWIMIVMFVLAGIVVSGAWLVTSPILFPVLLLLAALFLVLAIRLRRMGATAGALGVITLMLVTRVLPPVVLALPLYLMAQLTGMYDSLLGMVLVYSAANLPVALWLLLPVIGIKANEQEEAAQLDGATHATILVEILFPMIRGAVLASGLLIFLLCWNEYLFAAYLTSDHAVTLPIWMAEQLSMKEAQAGGEAEELGHMSAAAILMALPAIAFAALTIRAIATASIRRLR